MTSESHCRYEPVDWIEVDGKPVITLCECTNCRKWLSDYLAKEYNYCPKCGHKIEKED